MAYYTLGRPWPARPGGAFEELRRDMDALMRRFGSEEEREARGVFPAANLYETADAYVLTAELPGVGSGEIQILLEGTTVTLAGERKIAYADDGASVHRLERQAGTFRRAFELPVAVDAEKADAIHRNGVLLLRLPKAPEHQPRRISVRSAEEAD